MKKGFGCCGVDLDLRVGLRVLKLPLWRLSSSWTLVVRGLDLGFGRLQCVKLVYLARLLRPGFFLMHLVASWTKPSASRRSLVDI